MNDWITSSHSKYRIPHFLCSLTNLELAKKVNEKRHEYLNLRDCMEACVAREKPMKEADALRCYQLVPQKTARAKTVGKTVHGVERGSPRKLQQKPLSWMKLKWDSCWLSTHTCLTKILTSGKD